MLGDVGVSHAQEEKESADLLGIGSLCTITVLSTRVVSGTALATLIWTEELTSWRDESFTATEMVAGGDLILSQKPAESVLL